MFRLSYVHFSITSARQSYFNSFWFASFGLGAHWGKKLTGGNASHINATNTLIFTSGHFYANALAHPLINASFLIKLVLLTTELNFSFASRLNPTFNNLCHPINSKIISEVSDWRAAYCDKLKAIFSDYKCLLISLSNDHFLSQ